MAMRPTKPQKRRKLMPSSCSSHPPNSPQLSGKGLAITAIRSPICTSCHHALNSVQGLLVVCARCLAPTCAICSRTCTASPSSMPPTPHLTRSPTLTPTTPQSPRRLALTLHSANTNLGDLQREFATGAPSAGKRRKGSDDDQALDNEWEQTLSEFDLTLGCGRTICRNCCFENIQSNSTTCHDCYHN